MRAYAVGLLVGLTALSCGCEKAPSSREKPPESQAAAEAEDIDVLSNDARREHTARGAKGTTDEARPAKTDRAAAQDEDQAGSRSRQSQSASPVVTPSAAPSAPKIDKPLAHTFAPLGANSKAATQCEEDRDCTVSCYRDGRCCKELCGCSQVYSRTFAARLEQAVSQSCSPDVRCPAARCVGTKSGRAACEEGKCVFSRSVSQDRTPPQAPSL